MKALLLAVLALLALSGCGKRIVAPGEVVDGVAAFHAVEDAYWEKHPNGSEVEFWAGQPDEGGLPRHYRAMVMEMREVAR